MSSKNDDFTALNRPNKLHRKIQEMNFSLKNVPIERIGLYPHHLFSNVCLEVLKCECVKVCE